MTAFTIHEFDPRAFRRKRLPYLIALLSPLIAVDAILLLRFIEFYPARAAAGILLSAMLAELLQLLLTASVLLATAPAAWYLRLRSLRRRSAVLADPELIVLRTASAPNGFQFEHRFVRECRIDRINALRVRRSGAVVAAGWFETVRMDGERSPGSVTRGRPKRRCVIPAYYRDMDSIATCLRSLSAKPLSVGADRIIALSPNADDMYRTALGLLDGAESAPDYAQAFEWMADAADAGHADAAYRAALLIFDWNGIYIDSSVREAEKYLRMAQRAGHFSASEALARLRTQGIKTHAIPERSTPAEPDGRFRGAEFHSFDQTAYRRLRRPWVTLAFLVSAGLDLFILWVAVFLYPPEVAAGRLEAAAAVRDIFVLLALSSFFFIGLPRNIYKNNLTARSRGGFYTQCGAAVYVKGCLQRGSEDMTELYETAEYRIKTVWRVYIRNNSSVDVRGEIEAVSRMRGKRKFGSIVIPPYYENMRGIYDHLQGLIQ